MVDSWNMPWQVDILFGKCKSDKEITTSSPHSILSEELGGLHVNAIFKSTTTTKSSF